MFPVRTFLARRAPATVSSYSRSLKMLADHCGVDVDNLHTHIGALSKEELVGVLLTFTDSLARFNPNGQRHIVTGVMSYLSYNDIIIPKAHRTQIVPRKGETLRDKAFTQADVARVFNIIKNPIGRISLLILFSTGMRRGEMLCLKESDINGRVIHIRAECAKNKKARDVVMTEECADYLNNIWLPMKDDYIKSALNKNKGLMQMDNVRKAGQKSLQDDRLIPVHETTLSEILSRGFKTAGFTEQSADGRNLYHVHSLRKSFRTIVGSVDVDLAELLLGHQGYLSSHYVRIDDVRKSYDEKVAALLTISGNDPRLKNKVSQLESEVQAMKKMIIQMSMNAVTGEQVVIKE